MDDPLGTFSQIPSNVLHIKDFKSYMHCKFESIGDTKIHQELSEVCNANLSLKSELTHLEELNIIKYIFYTEFYNHDWS